MTVRTLRAALTAILLGTATAGVTALVLTAPASGRRSVEDVRTLLFFPYGQAAAVVRVLRVTRAASAAKRTVEPVQLRLDGVDVL